MPETPIAPARVEEEFSLPLFLVTVAASLAGLAGLVKLIAPQRVWQAQISAAPSRFAAAFLAITLLNCFIEFVFHRYVLHKPVVPLLSRFYKQHTLHHNLTRIGRRRTPGGREVPFVENIYPITTPEQGEASFFPWYTLAVFAAIVTPLLALCQWLVPGLPWFFSGYAALAGSLFLYEVFHAVEHWSFERWGPLIEHRGSGWFWRKVYSFHLRHHAVIDCNEAISGFLTLPVADWALGTFVLPKTLYADGQEWRAAEFVSPRPCALVRWCDAKTDAIVKHRRELARTAVSPLAGSPATLAYSRGEQVAHYLTHGVGLAASVAAFVTLVTLACLRGDARLVASCGVFGIALVLLYVAFTNFRRTRVARGRKLFDNYKHAAIFLLIAGTATPFLLGDLGGPWGWSLFGAVWGLCLTGGVVRLCCAGAARVIARFAYVALGLLALIAVKPLFAAVPAGALWLLLAGAICYMVGTIFHLWQRVHYHQVVRHAFAFGGSACHLIAVLLFVLPRT
jgi:hemolysin III